METTITQGGRCRDVEYLIIENTLKFNFKYSQWDLNQSCHSTNGFDLNLINTKITIFSAQILLMYSL